jgi:hypothetical protein
MAVHEGKWVSDIDPDVPPSGDGCVECDATGSWWFHLRRCATCGHIGCCDDSLNKHATAHAMSERHRYIQSFEPGEDWFWDYQDLEAGEGPTLAAPHSHPREQSTPGPQERVPSNWQQVLQDAGG